MMRVLLWKEYREHRNIWLAMAALSAIILLGLFELLEPMGEISSLAEKGEFIAGIGMTFSAMYGLICGAIMVAGEHEGGTVRYLDFLSSSRSLVWWAKLIAGIGLTLLQGLSIWALAYALGGKLGSIPNAASLAILIAYCWGAFAWGLLGSSLCRSVVMAAVIGMILCVVLTFVIGLLGAFFLFLVLPDKVMDRDDFLNDFLRILIVFIPSVLALASSGFIFCWADLDRRKTRVDLDRPKQTIGWFSSWRVLVWLTFRQGRLVWLILAVAGFILGLMVPFSENGMLIWPTATTAVGVLCGVGVFAPEQASGSSRFLGNQRMPGGRVWWVKTGVWLAAAAIAALFILAGLYLHLTLASDAEQHNWHEAWKHTDEVRQLVPLGIFITCWLFGGFSTGQFFSLVWRKSIVAVVVSLFVAAVTSALCFPSVVSGGLHWWQVFGFPIVLFVTTRLAMWAWISNRLYTVRPVALLSGGALLSFAALVGSIWYRVIEVPDVGEPFDVKAFIATIPVTEHNETRLAIQKALDEFNERQFAADAKVRPPKPIRLKAIPRADAVSIPEQANAAEALGPLKDAIADEQPVIAARDYFELIDFVFSGEVSVDDAQLNQWLDLVFQGDWMNHLTEAVQLPLAVFTDPRIANVGSDRKIEHSASLVAKAIMARALQLQSQKQFAQALDYIKTVLALSRHLRHKAGTYPYMSGLTMESHAIKVLDQWMHDLGPQPEFLRQAVEVLNQHAAAIPPNESLKAEYLITRSNLNIIDYRFAFVMATSHALGKERPFADDVLISAWLMPWEQIRIDRLNNLLFAGWMRGAEADYSELLEQKFNSKNKPGSHAWRWLEYWLPPESGRAASWTRERLADFIDQSILSSFGYLRFGTNARVYSDLREAVLQGTRLHLALMLYQYEEKRPAPNLEALVPKYLAELPKDPFNGESFHYRISKGESISHVYRGEPTKVLSDQGILWSVGPDGQDNDATMQGLDASPDYWSRGGLDLIFLVPPLPQREKK